MDFACKLHIDNQHTDTQLTASRLHSNPVTSVQACCWRVIVADDEGSMNTPSIVRWFTRSHACPDRGFDSQDIAQHQYAINYHHFYCRTC